MSRGFAIYIGSVGAAALAAIAWPGLVLVGLFLGIVPGLLLAVSPTVFAYSLLWWCAHALLRRAPGLAGIPQAGAAFLVVPVLSAVLVAAAAVLIPHLTNAAVDRAALTLQADDRDAEKPVVLSPVVALVLDGNYDWSRRKPFCETLCLRLLFNSAVARVIAVDPTHGNATSAFWIETGERCRADVKFGFGVRWTDIPFVRGDTWQDRVRARVAGGECLVEGDGRPEDAAMTISYRTVQKGVGAFERPWALQPAVPTAHRLEISDAHGATVYRQTEVVTEHLASPLRIETAAGLFTTATYAGWGRAKVMFAAVGIHGRDVLPHVLGAALRKPDKGPTPRPPG